MYLIWCHFSERLPFQIRSCFRPHFPPRNSQENLKFKSHRLLPEAAHQPFWDNLEEIDCITLIEQVKPGVGFWQTQAVPGHEGDQQNNHWRRVGKGGQDSYWSNSPPPDRARSDCFGKIIVPGENPATGTHGILSVNHLPLSLVG